jgi:hypothetical protein
VKLIPKRVFESALPPRDAHDLGVLSQGKFVASPHADGGMIPPLRRRVAAMLANVDAEGDEDLLALDALFAEPPVVKAPGRGPGVWVWQECLHGVTLPLRMC